MKLTAERLRTLLEYDPSTGLFTRRVRVAQAVKVGQIAGSMRADGYLAIKIDDRSYFAHRLAWLWMTSDWPVDEIDHKDHVRSNNQWSNLRPATTKQNNENQSLRKDNKSGYCGVTWCTRANKWRARIRHKDQLISLGYFCDPNQAHAARTSAERTLFTHFPTD